MVLPVVVVAAGVFAARPALWPWVLPALWPIIDLAPWTGWIHFTESDALVLAVVAGVGLREAMRPLPSHAAGKAFRVGPAALGLFTLLAISYLVSAWRTPIPLPPYDPALFASYKTPLNGVRLLKGFVLALALIPALQASGRVLGPQAPTRLATGLIVGLLMASLVATWERFAFPGLLNFAADYRTTALFWDMHVGGATLDGWLALTLPFALAAFLLSQNLKWRILTLAVLGVAAYATLTTFSRGLYAGVGVGLVVLLLALRSQTAKIAAAGPPTLRGGGWVAILLLLALAPASFAGGGYRGLAALLGFVWLIYLVGGRAHGVRKRVSLTAIALGIMLGLASLPATYLPKGPYLVFGALFFAGLALAIRAWQSPSAGRITTALALTAATGVAAAGVGLHWGEGTGSTGIILAVAAGLVILTIQVSTRPLWHATAQQATTALLVLGAVAALAAGAGSYYMGERFSTTSQDLQGRIDHWMEGASLVRTPADALFGIGLGRYPEAYFWAGPLAANAGSWQLPDEAGNRFSRLGTTRSVLGFGELFRISQQVPSDTLGPFHYRMRVRAPAISKLHLEVCRKHLLYTQKCAIKEFKVDADQWTEVSGSTNAGSLTPSTGFNWQPTVLSLAASGRAPVDVDDVEIIDNTGRMIVANGDFHAGVAHWFFSSDRHHLPWHAKSLPLHVWIEQGWLGVIAIGATLLAALARTALGRVRTHPFAPPLLAGLIGFLIVGIFDSLLDMPRMTIMLFLLCWVALTLAPPSARATSSVPN